MSAALDTLSPDEQKMLDQMAADDAASGELPPLSPPPPPPPTPEEPEPPAVTDQQPKTVPQEALHAERERRKRAEKELNELKAKAAADIARGEERLRLLTEVASAATAQPEAAAAPIPDPQVDPLGYVQQTTANLQSQIAQLTERVKKSEGLEQQIAQATLQQTQMQELSVWGQGQEAEFAAENPDYGNAIGFLRSQRVKQLEAMGYTNPAEINFIIGNDVTAMAQRARQTGQNFGEMLYRQAQVVGYQKGAAGAATAAPSPAPSPPIPDVAARVATAQRGAEMAGGLGGAGSAPRGELTPQALASMSDAEFASMYAKLQGNPAAMRQMFGE